MTEFESFVEKTGPREKEMERVQSKLEQFLPKGKARETALHIYEFVLSVDEEIGRILHDPLVAKLYEYDGLFFTAREGGGFHRAYDGIHILQSLNNSKLETFFREKEQDNAIQWLLQDLDTNLWVAKARRMNWEEEGTLRLLPKEVLEAIIEDLKERKKQVIERELSPLSPEEQAFFEPYEDQLKTGAASLKKQHDLPLFLPDSWSVIQPCADAATF